MELSLVYSRALSGVEAPLVQVETHLSNGLPAFHIVGLPETAVRESKDRVRSAILNSHFSFPDRRITVNLAPADLPKEGGRFDLPIALGILCASGQIPPEQLPRHEFQAELALDGSLRAVPGAIPAAVAASRSSRQLVVAADSAPVAALAPGSRVIGASDLLTLCAHLNNSCSLRPCQPYPGADTCNYHEFGFLDHVLSGRRGDVVCAFWPVGVFGVGRVETARHASDGIRYRVSLFRRGRYGVR